MTAPDKSFQYNQRKNLTLKSANVSTLSIILTTLQTACVSPAPDVDNTPQNRTTVVNGYQSTEYLSERRVRQIDDHGEAFHSKTSVINWMTAEKEREIAWQHFLTVLRNVKSIKATVIRESQLTFSAKYKWLIRSRLI